MEEDKKKIRLTERAQSLILDSLDDQSRFVDVCNKNKDILGTPGSELRRLAQKFRSNKKYYQPRRKDPFGSPDRIQSQDSEQTPKIKRTQNQSPLNMKGRQSKYSQFVVVLIQRNQAHALSSLLRI